jgi:Tol biopolymer transport system component
VDAVIYAIGLSTDPYGESRPEGIGLATGLATGGVRRDEVRDDDLGSFAPPRWIDDRRVVAARRGPPFRPPALFAVDTGRLESLGAAPLGSLEPMGAWSPDGSLVATEPIERCEPATAVEECYRQSGAIDVVDVVDGDRRRFGGWHLGGWTPDGRLLVTDDRGVEYLALDVETSRTQPAIDMAAVTRLAGKRRVGVGKPIWSADGEYVAALAGVPWGRRSDKTGTLVIARADGTPVRLVTSPWIISMLAWSPEGHRLAFTTSGFPDPHELFVLDAPDGEPRLIFRTPDRHFDWVTWSPDGDALLVDDEHAFRSGRWVVLDASTGEEIRELPRLGGAPTWCCPANAYVTLNG